MRELDELDNKNPYSNFDYKSYETNSTNYWENGKEELNNQNKKKKVTFDDILTNMNLVVNKNGVLQFMCNNDTNEGNNFKGVNNSKETNIIQTNSLKAQNTLLKDEPMPQDVKHSYIFNKYFKNYVNVNHNVVEPRTPKTFEEYRQMLLDDKIKAIQHKKNIEQIKSTKLMFTIPSESYTVPKNIVASKNTLRMMSFQ